MTTTLSSNAHDIREGLAAELRQATRAVHDDAEGSRFVTDLMEGQLDVSAFALMASQHLEIYRAMESVASRIDEHPIAGAIIDPALNRSEAIERDLEYYLGENWADFRVILDSTAAYVARIVTTLQAPHRFVAHHYTRYLGDLSGGQAIARLAARHYGLTEASAGLLFYHFPEIAKPKLYKDAYRAALNSLDLSEAERTELIAESIEVFRLNTRVFAELDRTYHAAR